MYACHLALTIEEPWISMQPISLGSIPSGRGTPDRYCLLAYEKRPVMRLDLFGQDMGFTDAVHFVSLDTHQQHSYSLHSYFGHLYSTENALLVASASDLLCFDKQANLHWMTEDLGIDGVVINEIEHHIIHGEGEWNPPGGWQPFTLSLHSGHSIQESRKK